MSIERYLRIIIETSKPKQVIKESVTPVKKDPEKVDDPYRSSEQVLGIVQRMMEDARVPQKPRQGPLRPQTGAGKHKDKKKDQKQGKTKHKGKNLDENNIPFAGLGKHKIGQAGQLRSPGPTGYPKGKLVGGAAESRFGRNRDDQFSLGGRIPRTDRIDRDSSSGQDAQQSMERKLKQQTIDRLLDKGFKVDALNGKSLPELIQMLREGIPYSYGFVPGRKKPNATTRHLRDYPVSDKDVAKPVKKPEKKKPEQGLAEMDKSQPSHGRDGKISHSTYGSRDKEGSDYFKGKEVPVKPITVKKMEKDALDILKKQGVAEGSDKLQGTPVVSLKDLDSKDTKKNKYGQTVPKKLKKDDPRVKFHKDEKQGVAEGSGKNVVKSVKVGNFRHDLVDTGMGWQVRIYNGDELYDTGMSKNSEQKGLAALEDAVTYTEKQTRSKRQGVAEEKQKGVDGKACWKGYKRMGTKKKGGRTVDNCVKMESISEGILKSFGLMEKSPPGFKGTVKAMKKHPELTKGKTKDGKEKNPWALAWHMKNKGYKSHKKADGSDKD